jgi:aquaporin Z
MKAYLTEFIGTFFLVLTVGLAVLNGTPLAPLAIGASLMVMVYMGGHISGGPSNPAVTLGVVMRGKLPSGQLVPYWISQLLGSLAASVSVWAILGQTFAPAPSAPAVPALLAEGFYTFALVLVVLNTATARATAGNSFYGLAIGFTVVVAAFAAGPVSGGAFNPAVGTGPTLIHALAGGGGLSTLWLYWVGPLAGGALAALAFRAQHGADAD